MADKKKLSALTRSLMIGVSTGSIALSQVGCAYVPEWLHINSTSAKGAESEESRLLNKAVRSRTPADVEAYLSAYPESPRVAPLLNSMPQSTLLALSDDAVTRLPESTLDELAPSVAATLVRDSDSQTTANAQAGRTASEY